MKLQILDFFSSSNQKFWLEKIEKSEWPAGKELANLIKNDDIEKYRGSSPKLFILVDGNSLVSYALYCKIDNIPNIDLKPWVGFVYTAPKYRGHHYCGKLINLCELEAIKDGYTNIYVSTRSIGLYEKYGFSFLDVFQSVDGIESRVYVKKII